MCDYERQTYIFNYLKDKINPLDPQTYNKSIKFKKSIWTKIELEKLMKKLVKVKPISDWFILDSHSDYFELYIHF
jgi:hypothetical protein